MNSKKIPAILAFCSLLAVSANAALVISNTDVANSKYTYSLTYADLLVTAVDPSQPTALERSGKFYNDAFSYSNVLVRNEGAQRYVNTEYGQSGSFTYRFDFSNTDFRATGVSIADRIVLFNNAATGAQIVVEYSVNGGAWTTLSSLTRTDSVQDLNKYSTPSTISFGSTVVSTFDYRVSFVGTTTSNFSDQWGRANSGQTPFSITFDVAAIPEPSSVAALMGLGVLGLTVFRRGRRSE